MSNLNVEINRTSGYTRATNFDLSINYTPLEDLLKIKWDFGDGSVLYDTTTVRHYYAVPVSMI